MSSLLSIALVCGCALGTSLWAGTRITEAAETVEIISPGETVSSAPSTPSGETASSDSAETVSETEDTVAPDADAPEMSTADAPEESALPEVLPEVLPSLPEPKIITPASVDVRPMTVTIIDGGQEKTQDLELVNGTTVAQVLDQLGITLDQYDRLYPEPDAPVYHGMRIRVTRVNIETQTRTVNFYGGPVRYKPTTELKAGQVKVLDKGEPGQAQLTERVWSKDGKVTLREEIARQVIREPEGKIVGLGVRAAYKPGAIPYHRRYARSFSLASRGGSPRDRMRAAAQADTLVPVRSMILTATGYSPDPRENGGYTRTATGLPIGYGAAAVDPRVIPLGTKLYVEGYGYAFACDTGGAIKGNRIDLAYDSYYVANTKGRKKVRVWILAPEEG